MCGLQAVNQPKIYHQTYAVAALALQLAGQSAAANENIAKAFELMPGFSLQNYRSSLPYDNEECPDRLIEIEALKALGVPEVSNV